MIRVDRLSKRYTIYDRPIDRLADWTLPWTARRGHPFWALREVSLEVEAGTALGVVGVNGAGKSTLLKLLTGTTVPTSGTFEIEGRVSALLELGMGFHPEFTGRENVMLNGKLSGLTDEELKRKLPSIVEFTELGNFFDQPLRTYSSGMAMRLAFAVASSVDPDVLIVDEAMAVGDLHFQHKCLARIREFREKGVTVLFVSHDPGLVKSFCNEAILLDAGCLIDRGKPDAVLDHYNALLAEKYRDEGSRARIHRPTAEANGGDGAGEGAAAGAIADGPTTEGEAAAGEGHRVGNFSAAIVSVEVHSEGVRGNSAMLLPGMTATISVRVVARESIDAPTVGILIKDRLGNEVYGVNTHLRDYEIEALAPGQAVDVRFSAPMNLGDGLYSITAAAHSGPTHTEVCYDWVEHAQTFQILPTPNDRFSGVCRLEMTIDHERGEATDEEMAEVERLGAS